MGKMRKVAAVCDPESIYNQEESRLLCRICPNISYPVKKASNGQWLLFVESTCVHDSLPDLDNVKYSFLRIQL